jgi:hypothetical protein
MGFALGVTLGVAPGAEAEVALGAELGAELGVAPIRGIMISRIRRIHLWRRQLAAMLRGSLRWNKVDLLVDGAGVRMGSQLQGFA